MNLDANALMLEYAKNPPNKFRMEDATIVHHESNRSCGDSMEVFLLLDTDRETILDFSFLGDTAIVTTGAAAIFGEQIIGESIQKILNLTYKEVRDMIGMDISPKRQMAASLALLATRNGIHTFLKDGKRDDFSDVLE